jgi:GNAT superfamily N-acetyltransferase
MIREADAVDLDAVMGLLGQLHPADPPVPAETLRSTLRLILAQPFLRLLVADVDGGVVATAYLNVIPNLTRSAAPYAVIENVVVDVDHRRSGIGRRLIAAALERAWGQGCYKVTLTTGAQRTENHAFYRACGLSTGAKTAFVVRRDDATSARAT